MYTTCLHCHQDLGRNESIELFPVGRRLAFDQSKGRLWVICTTCARWNLSPLEERWEAIEQCERAYRDTRKRVATGQIGLAKVGDGLTLVRIGQPLFPEYASWRYGARFVSRRTRHRVLAAAGVLGGIAVFILGPEALSAVAGVGGGGGYWMYQFYSGLRKTARERRHLGTVALPDGERLDVRGVHAEGARLFLDDDLAMRIEVEPVHAPKKRSRFTKVKIDPRFNLSDAPAREFLRFALPHINRAGATENEVALAVGLMGIDQGPVDPVQSALSYLATRGTRSSRLSALSRETGIGLEMAVMEGQERRWMETELHMLAASWQEAEKLAAIADSLTLPEWVSEKLGRLKGKEPS